MARSFLAELIFFFFKYVFLLRDTLMLNKKNKSLRLKHPFVFGHFLNSLFL